MSSMPDGRGAEPHPPAVNPGVAHEGTDANVRLIVTTAAILVATAVVIHVAVWGLFVHFKDRQDRVEREAFPLAVADSQRPLNEQREDIPKPRLEGLPPLVGKSPYLQAIEPRPLNQPELTGYKWVDRGKGIVQIPIETAMDVLVRDKSLLPVANSGKGPR
jgi:hypothetical protein